jgi:GNAT superfamily N-acetyltransferase
MNFAPPNLNYSDNTTKALTYLLPKGDGVTAMTECIYRVEGEILQASPAGVLLRHVVSGDYLLHAQGEAALSALLAQLPEDRPCTLLLHQREGVDLAVARFPHAQVTRLSLWRFPSLEPPRFPLDFEIWPLDLGDVADTLSFDPTLSSEALSEQITRKLVFGACIQDRLEGTVGTEPGGGISYLTVSPRLRGQGIGKTLLLWMIRKELQRGHVPFLLTERQDLSPLLSSVGLEASSAPLWRLVVRA